MRDVARGIAILAPKSAIDRCSTEYMTPKPAASGASERLGRINSRLVYICPPNRFLGAPGSDGSAFREPSRRNLLVFSAELIAFLSHRQQQRQLLAVGAYLQDPLPSVPH